MKNLVTILKGILDVKVIDNSIDYETYFPIDLSVLNTQKNESQLDNSFDFELYLKNYLKSNDSKVAYGGYNEERNLYKRSAVFKDLETEERNIHIGLDLWISAGTAVLAALDGKVHSFKFNTGLGDYGPTLILKHEIEHLTFYTLYGHLSIESIANLTVGKVFYKGEKIGSLGDASINGDYAPHLHFQIIQDMEHNFGDYPGVCSKSKLEFYLENCPDPNLLLKIK